MGKTSCPRFFMKFHLPSIPGLLPGAVDRQVENTSVWPVPVI